MQASASIRDSWDAIAFAVPSARFQSTIAYDEVVATAPGQGKTDQLKLGLIVHGLLGLGRNWRTFARSLAKQAAAESGR